MDMSDTFTLNNGLSSISSGPFSRPPTPPSTWITIDEWTPSMPTSTLEEGEIRSEWSLDFSQGDDDNLDSTDSDQNLPTGILSNEDGQRTSTSTYPETGEGPSSDNSLYMIRLLSSQQTGTTAESTYTATYERDARSPLVSYWEDRVSGDDKVRAFLRVSLPVQHQGYDDQHEADDKATLERAPPISVGEIKTEERGGSLTPPLRVQLISHPTVKQEFLEPPELPTPVPSTFQPTW